MRFDEYERYDGLGLGDLVARSEVSASELAEIAISRIEAINPKLNAVVHTMFESGRDSAAQPQHGPFAGVPFLLKDMFASVAGEPMTMGSRALADFRPDYDCTVVRRYRAAGLVFLGKTNMSEFGLMPVSEPDLFGPALNPWNLNHTPGGSSGGAAAAVASGMVPVAHAVDGGGSTRIPASCCGLFGLKPSRGRLPYGPAVDLKGGWAGGAMEHVVTRSVRDSAALLDATHGAEPGDPYSAAAPESPFLAALDSEPRQLRIAFTRDPLLGNQTHPDCIAAADDAASLCADLGHEVEEAHPPLPKQKVTVAFLIVIASELAHALTLFREHAGRTPAMGEFEPATRALMMIGQRLKSADLADALSVLRRVTFDLAGFFERHDILLTPTMAFPPPRIGELALRKSELLQLSLLRALPSRFLSLKALEEMSGQVFEKTANPMLFNITGQPAMSVPLFWNKDGLPIGVQFAGRFGEEATLFALAHQLEQARPWFDRRPAAIA